MTYPIDDAKKRRRIAVYYPWLYLTSGAERTILEIARRSRHRITIFTNEYQPGATFPELQQMDVRLLSRVPVERSLRSVASAAARLLSQELDLSEFDGLLVVCEGLGDLVALRQRRIPVFCLCLTPLRIAFDPVYRKRYLASRSTLHRLAVRAGTVLYRAVDRIAWRRYRRVFAISEEVKTRILAGRLAPADKMRTLHPGVELSAYAPSPPAERTFFVPGRIMWTKNLELAIQAFQIFRMTAPEPSTWKLVIAGIVDRKSGPYLDRLRSLAGGDPSVEFHVHPSDTQMRALYASSFAMLFTAFNEDWGLVLIEAMASGKPAVAVNRGGPKEIVRHEHDGLLSEPEPGSFAVAMGRLASEPGLYERLSSNAPSSAARFGWGPFIDDLDGELERELGSAGGTATREAA
ncbi:MAG: glycosyltransferase family 4 protein [Holophagales bacterium]|nr:glycosyltransferase family 4 protein [Holophagales bacterium]